MTAAEAPVPDWHAMPVADVVARLGTDVEKGLSQEEAARRLREYGPNQMVTERRWVRLKRLAAQFQDVTVLLLVVAALVSGVLLGAWVDAAAIGVIVILNALIGYVQETKAQTSLERLREMEAPKATVIRDGLTLEIPARDLVPGDLIVIEAGERVPADGRVVWDLRLLVNEAPLTGESMPVAKSDDPVETDSPVADRTSMVFSGTSVVAGRGRALVTATGAATQFGHIAALFSDDQPRTPLQEDLARIGRRLAILALASAALIFLAGIVRSFPVETMSLTAVAVAVAAIPEGLPAVITVSLAGGLQRMARRNAVIRRLPAVETLGVVNVICTDKTGTLTSPELEVGEWWSPDGGSPTSPDGWLARAAALCNNSVRSPDGWAGDPTETALMRALEEAGLNIEELADRFPRVDEAAFDARRKRMSTVHQDGGRYVLLTKGAPEILASRLASEDAAQALLNQAAEMARRGLRPLAFAMRPLEDAPRDPAESESDLVLLGMAGLRERIRPEVAPAVARAAGAGVRTVMVTGDHALTASAVAEKVGIGSRGVLEGLELSRMSVEELTKTVREHDVYARVDPADKVKIVQAWQAAGARVAMTGDGVNDAPALHRADIGIAMGSGTDIAREAAAMVLTDDNYASIVEAIAEGRRLFANLRNVVHYLLSANASEIFYVLVGFLVFGFIGEPLVAVQLLWINLISDSLPAIALGMETPTRDLMADPPGRGRDVLSARNTLILLAQGLILAGCAVAVLLVGTYSMGLEHEAVQTMVFTTLVFSQLLHALSIWSRGGNSLRTRPSRLLIGSIVGSALLQVLVVYTPFGNTLLRTVPVDAQAMGLVVGLSLLSMVLVRLLNRVVPDETDDAGRQASGL